MWTRAYLSRFGEAKGTENNDGFMPMWHSAAADMQQQRFGEASGKGIFRRISSRPDSPQLAPKVSHTDTKGVKVIGTALVGGM